MEAAEAHPKELIRVQTVCDTTEKKCDSGLCLAKNREEKNCEGLSRGKEGMGASKE